MVDKSAVHAILRERLRNLKVPDTPTPLAADPETMRLVGVVATNWSLVELHLQWLLWELLGVKSPVGQSLTTHVGTGVIVDSIKSIFNLNYPNTEFCERFHDVASQFNLLRSERNSVVHAMRTADNINVKVSSRGRRRQEFIAVPHSYYESLIRDIARLNWRLNAMIPFAHYARRYGIDILPSPLPDKHGQLEHSQRNSPARGQTK